VTGSHSRLFSTRTRLDSATILASPGHSRSDPGGGRGRHGSNGTLILDTNAV
jgi:hypothetical protein